MQLLLLTVNVNHYPTWWKLTSTLSDWINGITLSWLHSSFIVKIITTHFAFVKWFTWLCTDLNNSHAGLFFQYFATFGNNNCCSHAVLVELVLHRVWSHQHASLSSSIKKTKKHLLRVYIWHCAIESGQEGFGRKNGAGLWKNSDFKKLTWQEIERIRI